LLPKRASIGLGDWAIDVLDGGEIVESAPVCN
jgi:hypothetical protein